MENERTCPWIRIAWVCKAVFKSDWETNTELPEVEDPELHAFEEVPLSVNVAPFTSNARATKESK